LRDPLRSREETEWTGQEGRGWDGRRRMERQGKGWRGREEIDFATS